MTDKTGIMKLDPQSLIKTALTGGSSVEAIERLTDLAERWQANQARQAFTHAVAAFHRECPPITKTKKAQALGGYKWAPIEEILRVARPHLSAHGLSISWKPSQHDAGVMVTAILAHEQGHSETADSGIFPIDDQNRGPNAAQRVAIAQAYAVRYAVKAVLGLAPEDDTDAHTPAAPPIRQPQRQAPPVEAEIVAPKKSKPRKKKAEPTNDESATMTSDVIIDDVTTAEGETRGKAWVRYGIVTADGPTYGTFSETVADLARPYIKSGEQCRIHYTKRGEFLTAVAIEDLPVLFGED